MLVLVWKVSKFNPFIEQLIHNNFIIKANVALSKPSQQSSDFSNNGIKYTADRAIDGKKNIDAFEAPYISSTNGEFLWIRTK